MNDLLFNLALGNETDFPTEKPTEPNPHIPEHKPKEEPITEPEPRIPEFDPKKPMPLDPSAPEGRG
jgi:hypothetical protein